MDDKIYFLTKELKKEMDNDPRFIRLKELEEIMNNDEEVIALAYKKDLISNEYNDALKFYKEDSIEVNNAREKFIKIKDELNALPAVKNYLEAYNEIRFLLVEVNNILFSDFKGGEC